MSRGGLPPGATSGPSGAADAAAMLSPAREHLDVFNKYIDEDNSRLNVLCFIGGAALVLNGAFGVLDVFDAMSEPIYYTVNAYQVFFGLVTCMSELHPKFVGANAHSVLQHWQDWMHEWALGLTELWGRGLFYLFQGSLAVMSSSLLSLGTAAGVYMMFLGLICVSQHWKKAPMTPADFQDYYVKVDG
eukprot:TRINITY_DN111509_c0_g1_i1.p1 TRINITY_DN111509_c0_g1~~TRINITY_DN111509_c0_g1_i1.p1  ORF type:complete len:188 (-),score=43.30 TRINITY_DN111509_c0_g1_i1:187-750(-)